MKNFILFVAIVVSVAFVTGCGKAHVPTGVIIPTVAATVVPGTATDTPVVTATSTSTITATVTETSTSIPGTPTVTATSTTALTPFPTVIPSGTPVCSISLTTGSSIPVVIVSGTYVGVGAGMHFVPSGIGTLYMSNNGLIPIPYNTGDVLRISAQDQTSMEIITIISSWNGGGTIATTTPNGSQNWVDILP
jgi:hypothetical protein